MPGASEPTTRQELLNQVEALEKQNERLEEAITHLTDTARDVMVALGGEQNRALRHEVTALRNAIVWASALSRQREVRPSR